MFHSNVNLKVGENPKRKKILKSYNDKKRRNKRGRRKKQKNKQKRKRKKKKKKSPYLKVLNLLNQSHLLLKMCQLEK